MRSVLSGYYFVESISLEPSETMQDAAIVKKLRDVWENRVREYLL